MSPQAPSGVRPLHRQLHTQILAAMAVGAVIGLAVGEAAVPWVGWLGTIFVRLLKMIIVPLIFTSVVSGVASVGVGRKLGRLGAKTVVYYLVTSFLAILIGLAVVNLVKPGEDANIGVAQQAELPELETPGSLAEIFFRLVPSNPIDSMASGDMLAIIFFAILIGVATTRIPEGPRERIVGLVNAAFDVVMTITGWIIRLAPLGVLGLITRAVAGSGFGTFKALGMYMVTIAAGLTFHLLVTLPLLLWLVGRIKPWIHFRNMTDAMVTAFSTSSSSATLPITMRCVEKEVGVSNRISSFVLPMGATINMDGTALYECVGVIFISQVLGFHLPLEAQAVVVLTALLASIGAAGIPSAGLVMIFIVTEAINLRGPEVATVVGAMLAIDRPLDMYRTMINVFSDSCGAAIIARTEGETEVDSG
jgi:Na+/H+-dicarboxylate symporter